MSKISMGLSELFNHPEFPDSLKPALGTLILLSLEVPVGRIAKPATFIGFKSLPASWLTRDIDRYPPCAN